MTLRWKPLLVLLTAGFLGGCPQSVPVDVDRASLMPESVARRVVERRLGVGWLERPYLDRLACFRTGVRYVPMEEIRGALYIETETAFYITNYYEITLDCDAAALRVANMTMGDARELTTALVSLGAAIRQSR